MNKGSFCRILQKKNILLLFILFISICAGLKIFQNEILRGYSEETFANMEISIFNDVKKTEELQVVKETLPYETITKGKTSGSYTTKVITDGQEGEELIAYKVMYLGKNEIKREVVASKVTKEAVNKVLEKIEKIDTNVYASRGAVINRSVSAPSEYVKVIDMKATAYCLCEKCCGKSESHPQYGVTRSGLKIVPGTGMKVIAVDPKVIPLGTTVYVEGLNGVADYGYAIAADTGGAIKNNKIDLYMETHDATMQWGIKNVRVYVVE